MDLADKRRMARRLIGRTGRGFAERAGFPVTNNPATLFQLLCLSVLGAARPDLDAAVRSARALRERGWDTPARLAASPDDRRLAAIRGADPRRDARRMATELRALAQAIAEKYQGDLRRLRAAARRDPDRERQLLRALPGVSDAAVDLFFREVQAGWREIAPFADRRALAAARKLGLGQTTADLYEVAGGGESEKLAWLVGALVRVDLDGSYDRARRLSHP
ncbi:hypothetical protein [Rugosimonospora africana]|nr:hypothetical protein [Rugosimonospora africana]